MRSVVYLIISLIALFYLLDAFLGKHRVNNWIDSFIGDFGGVPIPENTTNDTNSGSGGAATNPSTAPAAAPAKAPQGATDTGKIRIPDPMPDTGKIKIPQPQGNQTWQPKTKSGSGGFSLNDIFGHFNPFPLGVPIAAAGTAAVAGLTQLPTILGRKLGGAF